jgi:hypothetical protein
MINEAQSAAIAQFRDAIGRFTEVRNSKIEPANQIPQLLLVLTRVGSLIDRINPNALGDIPPLILGKVSTLILQATKPTEDYLLRAYDPEELRGRTGEVPPLKWARTKENTTRWLKFLDDLEAELFKAAQPIVFHQEIRALQLTVAKPITVDYTKSASVDREENTVLWRYLPLANVERTIMHSGLWMSSLTTLRRWSRNSIRDTKEGDVPPVLARLKDELLAAEESNQRSVLAHYGLSGEDVVTRLKPVLSRVADPSVIFSCSWSANEQEDSLMWMAYGDRGQGIALKTTVGKLARGPWRVPSLLSGFGGGPTLHDLMLRKVHYLRFDNDDVVTGFEPEDFYLPFLKRKQFDSEREWRLLAISRGRLSAGGLIIQCDLSALIDEIVIGPHANGGDVEQVLKYRSPYLLDTPLRNSTIQNGE